MTTSPLPFTVQQAIVVVCKDAFHYRDDVRAVFVQAGVPPTLYSNHDHPSNSKAKIARQVLSDLHALGHRGYAIQRRIVEELCRLSKPHAAAPDQHAGKRALDDLRNEATTAQILVNPEVAAAEARKAAAQRRVQAMQDRKAKLGGLHAKFVQLNTLVAASRAELQRRGYDFERLLADLFRLDDLEFRPSYRIKGGREQVDGSFQFRGFPYLVEARWRANRPDVGDLADFKMKVDGKMESTRGLFISMAGFDPETVDHVTRIARGSRNNIILMDGGDVSTIFEGLHGLIDALTVKIDAAEQEGLMWRPL